MTYSAPFFFEPNFDALVQPTDAALKLLRVNKKEGEISELLAKYPPVVYGEHLKGKVGSNFTD